MIGKSMLAVLRSQVVYGASPAMMQDMLDHIAELTSALMLIDEDEFEPLDIRDILNHLKAIGWSY
jgi:hypothetical protein